MGFADGVASSGLATVTPDTVTNAMAWSNILFHDLRASPAYPWTVGELGLAWFRDGRWEQDFVTLVTGESPWDFTLFLALRRWRTYAYWLPPQLLNDQAFMHGLVQAMRSRCRQVSDPQVRVVTTSDEAFRDRLADDLSAARGEAVNRIGPQLQAITAPWRTVLPARPHRLRERNAPGRREPVALVGGTIVELATPVPRNARPGSAGHLTWVNDAPVQGWAPIRHGDLAKEVVSAPWFDSQHARTSRAGVSYTAMAGLTFSGSSLEMSVSRPVLHPLGLIPQLNGALGASGWTSQASDKGAYDAESALLFGGLRALTAGLLDPGTRAVLDAFRDPKAPSKKAGGRKYLTLADMATALSDEEVAEAVCDDLSNRDVLTRGLFLKCGTCRAAAWYELAAVTVTFACRRCRRTQPLRRANWLGTVEPLWYYELAEVVHALLDHNGELPLLAVHQFFPLPTGGDDDVEVAFELDVFSPDGRKSEVDIAVRDGTRLWLGEATTKNCLEQNGAAETARLRRLSDTADVLAATDVLLASSRGFREASRGRARAIFGSDWPRLHIEENVVRGGRMIGRSLFICL